MLLFRISQQCLDFFLVLHVQFTDLLSHVSTEDSNMLAFHSPRAQI